MPGPGVKQDPQAVENLSLELFQMTGHPRFLIVERIKASFLFRCVYDPGPGIFAFLESSNWSTLIKAYQLLLFSSQRQTFCYFMKNQMWKPNYMLPDRVNAGQHLYRLTKQTI